METTVARILPSTKVGSIHASVTQLGTMPPSLARALDNEAAFCSKTGCLEAFGVGEGQQE